MVFDNGGNVSFFQTSAPMNHSPVHSGPLNPQVGLSKPIADQDAKQPDIWRFMSGERE
jgi:hypothetical protein